MKVFGIGCIFFRYNTETGMCEEFEITQFKQDVIDTLSEIENISNLVADGIDDKTAGFRSFSSDADEKIIPVPINFSLSFDILIPFRIQEEFHFKATVELFHVDIVYGYERPVAYFSYDSDDPYSGSLSVAIVRKFLERKTQEKDIVCDSIGPSPFHANFNIGKSDDEAKLDTLVRIDHDEKGYDDLSYFVDEHTSNDEGLAKFIYQHNEIFSAFYYLKTLGSKLNHTRSEVINKCSDLVEERREAGLLQRLKPSIVRSSEIGDIHKNLIRERLVHSETKDFLAEINRERPKTSNSPLAAYFDTFTDDLNQMNLSDFNEVVKLFELRRQSFFSNASVLIAGLFGGLVGAALTAFIPLAIGNGVNQLPQIEGNADINATNPNAMHKSKSDRSPSAVNENPGAFTPGSETVKRDENIPNVETLKPSQSTPARR